ncbi:MAG: OmpA family protein [Synechocystis sp.]|nr:OmpA family protein [Synechocystis sp.]
MFEMLINQLAQQFGLGDKAGPLVSQVLGMMTQSSPDGMPGFLSQLTQGGLGSQVESWIGSGENQPLPPNDLQQVLGNPIIEQIAERTGLPIATALPAIASVIPGITDKLTPNGQLPASLPPEVNKYLPAIAGLAGATGLGGALGTLAQGAASPTPKPQWDTNRKAALGASLASVAALGLFGGMFGGQPSPRQAAEIAPPPAETMPAPDTPAPENPEMAIANPFDDLVLASKQKAKEALTALQPGAYGGEELTKALNVLIINFATGSAEIPPEDGEFLKEAAEAMKGLPPETAIEVAGHTDTTGDAAANQLLSQQRAESVVKALVDNGVDPAMLQAKGYGGESSVASNETEEGRFQNRRIEFILLKPVNPQ